MYYTVQIDHNLMSRQHDWESCQNNKLADFQLTMLNLETHSWRRDFLLRCTFVDLGLIVSDVCQTQITNGVTGHLTQFRHYLAKTSDRLMQLEEEKVPKECESVWLWKWMIQLRMSCSENIDRLLRTTTCWPQDN